MTKAKISYKIDVLGTLDNMSVNSNLILVIAGKNRDCSYSAVQQAKKKAEESGKKIKVTLVSDNTAVEVTRIV